MAKYHSECRQRCSASPRLTRKPVLVSKPDGPPTFPKLTSFIAPVQAARLPHDRWLPRGNPKQKANLIPAWPCLHVVGTRQSRKSSCRSADSPHRHSALPMAPVTLFIMWSFWPKALFASAQNLSTDQLGGPPNGIRNNQSPYLGARTLFPLLTVRRQKDGLSFVGERTPHADAGKRTGMT